ncbi:MAG: hypothetical protein HXX13_02840 [Bacteroidetes bacterium]|nr:hypothetical protein [Bacteroidota bacterium]
MNKLVKIVLILLCFILVVYVVHYYHKIRRNQSNEIKKEYARDASFIKDDLHDLPLLRFESGKNSNDFFIVIFPGDGGWRDFIDYLSKYFCDHGINTVGINTIPYLSDTRKPEEIAKDITRVINNFSEVWNKKKVVLAGYSFGAEILPFVYNRLDSTTKAKIICLGMIAPSGLADFKVSPVYYYNPKHSKPVMPELSRIKSVKTLVFCDRDKESICKEIHGPTTFDIVHIDHGHLFTGKFPEVSSLITNGLLNEIRTK